MKIILAYIPEEEGAAAADLAALRKNHPGARVHKSDRHPPFKHIYIATRKSGKPHNFKESACTIPPDMV